MAIRWDSVLVRDLARELDVELLGSRLRAIRLDARTRDVVLFFRKKTLLWRLHPERSGVWLRDSVEPQPGDLRIRAQVRNVRSIADERIIFVELRSNRASNGPWALVIELLGNRMNAMMTEGSDLTIRHILRTQSGSRNLRVGQPWSLPKSTGRRWIDGMASESEWKDLLAPVPPTERQGELLSNVAWTSRLNADACLTGDSLSSGLKTWRLLANSDHELGAVLLETDHGPQPYPMPLPGVSSRSSDSLLAAIAECESLASGATEATLSIGPELLERLEDAIAHVERRIVQLTAQFDNREDPGELRNRGDILLARYPEISPGSSSAQVHDFEGNIVELELDPKLKPYENASRYYDRASRSERAAQRLPGLIESAHADMVVLQTLLKNAYDGTAQVDQIRAALPASPSRQRRGSQNPTEPYRTFVSSGGLEIRVGRGARHNDDLTFRHSSPKDIWLHARHTAGAHVILRWQGPGAPPERDLQEAASLAALHSKARTSEMVPVDWTLRKYVRKPRGSAAGAVVPDRVRTLFVTPDPELVERHAVDHRSLNEDQSQESV